MGVNSMCADGELLPRAAAVRRCGGAAARCGAVRCGGAAAWVCGGDAELLSRAMRRGAAR